MNSQIQSVPQYISEFPEEIQCKDIICGHYFPACRGKSHYPENKNDLLRVCEQSASRGSRYQRIVQTGKKIQHPPCGRQHLFALVHSSRRAGGGCSDPQPDQVHQRD